MQLREESQVFNWLRDVFKTSKEYGTAQHTCACTWEIFFFGAVHCHYVIYVRTYARVGPNKAFEVFRREGGSQGIPHLTPISSFCPS